MILDIKVKVFVSGNMVNYYQELGYDCKCNDKIDIDISHLKQNSPLKINVSCDICSMESLVKYQNYNKQLKKGGYYCCHGCSRDKNRKTSLERYGSENYNNREKAFNTNLQKYGVYSYSKTDEYREKFTKTSLERYGVEIPAKSNIVKDKVKLSNNEKYGCDYPNQLEHVKNKTKITCLEKYGFDNAAKSELVKSKITNTNIERYGEKSWNKNVELFNGKKFKRILSDKYNLYYDSSYELDFLKLCESVGITDVKRGLTFRYSNDNVYYPDFFIEKYNLIVEIKSNYIFNLDYDKNMCKKESVVNSGYNFLFIIDKNYTEFLSIIN